MVVVIAQKWQRKWSGEFIESPAGGLLWGGSSWNFTEWKTHQLIYHLGISHYDENIGE